MTVELIQEFTDRQIQRQPSNWPFFFNFYEYEQYDRMRRQQIQRLKEK